MKKIITYLLLCGSLMLFAAQAPAQSCVKVEVSGFRAIKGKLYISIYKSQDAFLKIGKEITTKIVRVNDSTPVDSYICDLQPGWYAVALYHDEDDNDKMNSNFLGMPREPYGLSNNIRPRFSYPKFKQCEFYVTDKQEKDVAISLVWP